MLHMHDQSCWLATGYATLLPLLQCARLCCQAQRRLPGLLLQPLPRKGMRLKLPLLMQSPGPCTSWAPSSRLFPSSQVTLLPLHLDAVGDVLQTQHCHRLDGLGLPPVPHKLCDYTEYLLTGTAKLVCCMIQSCSLMHGCLSSPASP